MNARDACSRHGIDVPGVWVSIRCHVILAALMTVAAVCAAGPRANNPANAIPTSLPAHTSAPQNATERSRPIAQDPVTERLLKSLRRQPRPGAAFDRLVQQLEEAGTVEEFTDELRSELQSAPADNDGSTATILGLFELRSRRFESARSLFQTASKQRPRDPVVFWLLGSVALELGDSAATIDACENALALKPPPTDLPGIARDFSAALRKAGRAAEVPALWTRIEAADPDNLRLCEQAATALRDARLPEQALIRYQRLAAELDDPWRRTQARLAAADLKRQLGQTQQALADEESLLDELDPDSWQARQVLDRIEEVLRQSSQQNDLLTLLNRRLERGGHQPDLLQRIIRLLRLQNRSTEAMQLLEQQLKTAPENRSLRLLLVTEYTRGGRVADAVAQYQALDQAGLLRPDDREAWGQLLLADRAASESPAESARRAAVVWRAGLTEQSTVAEIRRVSELLRGAGLVSDALPLLQQALDRDLSDSSTREQLGSCLHSLGRREEALSVWQELANGDRRSPEAFHELSAILQAHGEQRAAIDALHAACDVLPTVPDLLRLASAQLEFRDGSTRPLAADSLPVLTRAAAAAQTFADWQRVVEQQATALQQLGMLDDALQQFRSGPATSRTAALSAPEIALPATLLSQLQHALLERSAGNPELALQAVRETLSAAPEEVAVLQLASELSAAAGLPSAALELREQLLQRDERGRLKHLADLMTLTQQMGLHERAAEHAQNLLQTAPDDPAMLTAAAEVLAECGRSELAATALEAVLKRQPDAPAPAVALASLLAELGQTSRALDVCRNALEHTTENRSRAELARLLAELYQQLGSPDDVLQWLESRVAEADDTARGEWLQTLAEVHKSSGQTTLARRTLERCLQLDGPSTAVLLELSELALRQRDPESAVASLRQIRAAELDPTGCRQLLDLALRAGPVGNSLLKMVATLPRLETSDHVGLLDRLLQQRRFSEARDLAETLLHAGRRGWELRIRLATALSRSGETAAATPVFQQLLDISLPLLTPSADAVRTRPGKNRLRLPAGADAANPELWDVAWENSTRILLDLSPRRDQDVFSEGWCDSFAAARILAIAGLLLAENSQIASPSLLPNTSSRPVWDSWVHNQFRAVVQNVPAWSLSEALKLTAEAAPHAAPGTTADTAAADAAILSTAIQLFAPVGSQPLIDSTGHWLGIQWRMGSERRRHRVRQPDTARLAGLQTAFRNAAAHGDAELCERSAAAVAAACQHAGQPTTGTQLLEYLQRHDAAPSELLAAIFLQQAVSAYSPAPSFALESRLQMLDRMLAAMPPEQLRTRALQLPLEWLQLLPANTDAAAEHRMLCHWWLRQSDKDDSQAELTTELTTAPDAAFHDRCRTLLQTIVPADERTLLQRLVQHSPRDALQIAEAKSVAAEHPLRAALLLAAAANETANLPQLLAAAEQLLILQPASPLIVFLAADCRQRAGLLKESRQLLLNLPPGLPAQSRQRLFRLLELVTLLREPAAVDATALELAGMELSSADRSQLLSFVRISGSTNLLLELQQRQNGTATSTPAPTVVLQELRQLQQAGRTTDAVLLARRIVSSDAAAGQGGARFRRPASPTTTALRDQAMEVLKNAGELDRLIEQQQQGVLRDMPDSTPTEVAAVSRASTAVPLFATVPVKDPDWLGNSWPALGPLPVRIIHQRLQQALETTTSGQAGDGFEMLLGMEEQDAVRAAAWLAKQSPAPDPISLSALRRQAMISLTPAAVQRMTARRIQQLRDNTDPGPSWNSARNWLLPKQIISATSRGPGDAAMLTEQLHELRRLAPEEDYLCEVLELLLNGK